jgi:CHAT domain-containing protein
MPLPNNWPSANPPISPFLAQLAQAATALLQGAYSTAEAALQEAENLPGYPEQRVPLLERFRCMLRYECYERMPTEINIYLPDVAIRKEKTGGMPRKELGMLAETGVPELDIYVAFLNERYQHWLWRTTRNLLRGSRFAPDASGIAAIYQRELATCQQRFAQGDYLAGLTAAGFCRSAGESQVAIQWLSESHQLAEQKGDFSAQATCLLQAGDWLAAPYSSPLIWNFALEASSTQSSALPSSVENNEYAAAQPAQLLQARQFWEQATTLFTQAQDKAGLAQVQLRLAYLAALEGHWELVQEHAQAAQTLFATQFDAPHAQLAASQIVMALTALKRIPEALILAKSIGEWGSESGNVSWTASLGLILARFARHFMLRLGEPETALKAYRITRTLQQVAGNPLCAAQHLTDMGEIYKAIGQTDAAIAHLEQAADEIKFFLNQDLKDFQDELNTALHTSTGIVMLLSDNFNLGLRRMDVALMERSIQRMQAACTYIENAATPAQRETMPQISQVLGLYAQMAELAQVLLPLYQAKHLRDQGDLLGFEQAWQKAFAALGNVSPAQQAVLSVNVWGMKRDWAQAGAAMRQYLGLGGANSGFLDDLLQFMQRFGEQGQEEIQVQQYRALTQALSGLVRTKQFADAQLYLEKLQNLFGPAWWVREEAPWSMLSDCGELMEGLGRMEAALDFFDLGIAELEKRRAQLSQDAARVGLADAQNTRFLFAYAARAAMAHGQKERALRYAELGKARGLLDLMAENQHLRLHSPEGQALTLQRREMDAQHSVLLNQMAQKRAQNNPDPVALAALNQQIQDLEANQSALEQSLSGLTRFLPAAALDFDLLSLCNSLPADSLLIEYLVASNELLIWALNARGILHAEVYPVEDWVLMSEIHALREAITQRRPWQVAATALATRLLSPLVEALQQHRSLVIVAHGPLHTLPFQVLLWEGNTPLGQSHQLCYLPSASALNLLERVKPLSEASVLAIGNPGGDLAAAGLEAQFVAQQYGADAVVLLEEAATEAAVRAHIANAELLHFATHGYLSEDAPLQSSLLLAHQAQFTLQELMGIRLQAELVVLSACDTARGTRTGGDDVLGLSRGLIASGAKAAIVSLWPVNDASTALFMGHFYQQLKAGATPAKALWSAQVYLAQMDQTQQSAALRSLEQVLPDTTRSVRDLVGLPDKAREGVDLNYSHPYYWAGFILIGGR